MIFARGATQTLGINGVKEGAEDCGFVQGNDGSPRTLLRAATQRNQEKSQLAGRNDGNEGVTPGGCRQHPKQQEGSYLF